MTSLPTTAATTSLRSARIAAGFAGLLLIAAAFLGAGTDVLLALPVVLLIGTLLADRYPGLQTLVRIAKRLHRRRSPVARLSPPVGDTRTLAPRALRLLVGTRILRGPPSASPVAL